jgi:hypothetical protein
VSINQLQEYEKIFSLPPHDDSNYEGYSFSFVSKMICVLVHYKNGIPPLRSRHSSSSDNRNESDLMVIDATDINRSIRMAFNAPCVSTCDASIGTSINERTFLSARGLGNTVLDIMRLDLLHVRLTVNRDFMILNLSLSCLGRLGKDQANISGMAACLVMSTGWNAW